MQRELGCGMVLVHDDDLARVTGVYDSEVGGHYFFYLSVLRPDILCHRKPLDQVH